MGTTTDYKEKYLKSFFKWQNSYESACQKVRELEEKLKIAEEALELLSNPSNISSTDWFYIASETLKKIKELKQSGTIPNNK